VLFLLLNLVSICDIFLLRGVVLQLIVDAIDGQVAIVHFVELVLEGVEYLSAVFRLKHVVVLVADVDDELIVVWLGRLGHGLNGCEGNPSLHLRLLDVVETLVGEQKCSLLLHAPSVILDNSAREDNLLTISCVHGCFNFWVGATSQVVIKLAFAIHLVLKFIENKSNSE
jgi:hypothetical protein